MTERFVVCAWVEVVVREVRFKSEDDADEKTPPAPTKRVVAVALVEVERIESM